MDQMQTGKRFRVTMQRMHTHRATAAEVIVSHALHGALSHFFVEEGLCYCRGKGLAAAPCIAQVDPEVATRSVVTGSRTYKREKDVNRPRQRR